MRLIDADAYLERVKKDPLFDLVERHGFSSVLAYEPTVDAIPVVKCKDCTYCGVFNMCTYNGRMELMGENDYCSRGKNETHQD